MSEEFNPIIRKEVFNGRKRLGSERPRPNVSTALVFVKDGRIVEIIKEGDKANWGILVWGGYDSMYEVNLATFRLESKIDDLPSKNSSSKMFEAIVGFNCKVDPEHIRPIIKEKITNVRNVLMPRIETIVRKQSSSYSIEERQKAEQNICDSLENEITQFAENKGLLIDDITLKLKLNIEAQTYLSDLEKSSDALKQNDAKHHVDLQITQQQVELERIRTTSELEILKIKQESEMSIMQQKVQLYELMLKQGSLDALRLAQDPNSAEQIRKEQIQSEILKMKFTLEGFVSMAETGAIAAPELAEHAKRLLSSNLFNNTSDSNNVLGLTDGKQQSPKEYQSANESTVNEPIPVSKEDLENPDGKTS